MVGRAFNSPLNLNRTNRFLFLMFSSFKRHINNSFSTSIYRKKTFTGLYTQWDSFTPWKYEINLIRTLTYRCMWRQRGRVVRAPDLKSVGRGFNSRSVGILSQVMFIYHYLFTLVLKSPDGEWPITYTFTFTFVCELVHHPVCYSLM